MRPRPAAVQVHSTLPVGSLPTRWRPRRKLAAGRPAHWHVCNNPRKQTRKDTSVPVVSVRVVVTRHWTTGGLLCRREHRQPSGQPPYRLCPAAGPCHDDGCAHVLGTDAAGTVTGTECHAAAGTSPPRPGRRAKPARSRATWRLGLEPRLAFPRSRRAQAGRLAGRASESGAPSR